MATTKQPTRHTSAVVVQAVAFGVAMFVFTYFGGVSPNLVQALLGALVGAVVFGVGMGYVVPRLRKRSD